MVDWAKLVVTATELDGMFNMLSSDCCSIRGLNPGLVTLSNVGFEPTSSGVLVVCCLLVVVCCVLFFVCRLLFVVCCLLFVGCWLLVVGCWLLVVGFRLLAFGYNILNVVYCVLCVDFGS